MKKVTKILEREMCFIFKKKKIMKRYTAMKMKQTKKTTKRALLHV